MSNLVQHFATVASGQAVEFRPRGTSMRGLVNDRDLVRVEPCRPELLEVGDVVLVRVAGRVYLHKVITAAHRENKVRIGNNRGGVNGWAPYRAVAGICTHVNGTPRRGASTKLV